MISDSTLQLTLKKLLPVKFCHKIKEEYSTTWKKMIKLLLLFPAASAATKLLQSCLTLCDPIDGSPPGSPIPGILQARILEWVAISFSSAWNWKVKVKSLSHVQLLATPWTAAHQAPLSMGFSRQEYWTGVSLPSLPFPATYLCKTRFSSFTSTKTTLSNKLKAEADMNIPLSAIKPEIYKNIKQLTLSSIIY